MAREPSSITNDSLGVLVIGGLLIDSCSEISMNIPLSPNEANMDELFSSSQCHHHLWVILKTKFFINSKIRYGIGSIIHRNLY